MLKAPMAGLHDLVYALRDGKLISIRQVGRGLQPDCLCPACGSPLIAKKGLIRQHHFAHKNGNSCESAAETALHLLAKQVICSPGTRLALPPYKIVGRRRRGSKSQAISETVPGVGGAIIQVAEGQEEFRFEGFTADALISVQSGSGPTRKELIVEIAVTNPCSKAKIRRIAAVGISAIEIDLREFPHYEGMSFETVLQVFLDPQRVKWLFHPKQADARKSLARKLRAQRLPFDVLRTSPSALPEFQCQTKGGAGSSVQMRALDAYLERRMALYGPPTAEQYREWVKQFESRRKPWWRRGLGK
ncbi:MAG: competence protein CoiA family protein [Wenzhouxiangella sp.]